MSTVLQVNIGTKGSTGTIAESINRIALSNGWKAFFAYGRSVGQCESQLIHVGNKLSQAIALLEARLFDCDGLSSRIATYKLVKKIKRIQPDIIHLHNLHGYYINYKILFEYLNSTDIIVIWTLHDCWSFTGHCAHFVGAKCNKWKTGCYHCPLKKSYPKSIGLDCSSRNYILKKSLFTSNKNLHIITVSQWLANFARQSFFKNNDIQVIHNGVNLKTFHPYHYKPSNKFRVIGVSSFWTKSKGLCDFFELRKRLDRDKYDITLIGMSEEQIKELPEGIEGVRKTSSILELARYYAEADVFVNPTYADSFPTTNLESLACGTPVIIYNTGGCPEAVDENTGIIVEQGDINELHKAVIFICQQGKNYYSDDCRVRAEQYFNRDDRFADYMKLYIECLRRND